MNNNSIFYKTFDLLCFIHKKLLGRLCPVSKDNNTILTYRVGCLCFYLTSQYPILFKMLGLDISASLATIFGALFLIGVYLM